MTEAQNSREMLATLKCQTCGAPFRPTDTRCWLCGAPAPSPPHGEDHFSGGATPSTPSAAPSHGFSLASLMMFVTLLSVVFGLSTIVPGIGIPLGVLLLVAWGRTVSVSRRREALGTPLTRSQQIQTYVSSAVFVFAQLSLVAVGVCVAAGSISFGMIPWVGGIGGGNSGQILFFVACLVAMLAAVGIFRLAAKWNDENWRRSIGENKKTPNDRTAP